MTDDDRVALRKDLPAHKLKQGDVATIVEHHPVEHGEDGYCLEIFNAIGETLAVVVVAESQIEPLMENGVLHIRVLDEAVRAAVTDS